MEIVASPLFRTGAPDGHDEPSSSADDRGHDDPQSLAGDAAILSLRRCEVQPSFQPAAGSARHGAGPRLPAPPHRPEALVVAHQPGRVRPALLLRRHARAEGSRRADRQRPGAREASAGAQSRGVREYRQGIEDAEARLERLTQQIADVLTTWRWLLWSRLIRPSAVSRLSPP